MVEIKEIENFKEYGKVVSISNGIVEAFITLDLGPRIIKFAFTDSQNIMNDNRSGIPSLTDDVYEDYYGKGKRWENFGGHRIWATPESYPETLYPDDSPVEYTKEGTTLIFTPKPETENGFQKQLIVKMSESTSELQVTMRIKNISSQPKKYSVWGISTCAAGGTLIVPMNTNNTGRLPNRKIVVWPYTNMSDDRVYFGNKYVTLSQKPSKTSFKLGFDLNCGTVYYCLGEDVYIKKFITNHPDGNYIDEGCSFETYTCNEHIEIEALGEFKTVEPMGCLELCEDWSLTKADFKPDFKDDNSIDEFLKSL